MGIWQYNIIYIVIKCGDNYNRSKDGCIDTTNAVQYAITRYSSTPLASRAGVIISFSKSNYKSYWYLLTFQRGPVRSSSLCRAALARAGSTCNSFIRIRRRCARQGVREEDSPGGAYWRRGATAWRRKLPVYRPPIYLDGCVSISTLEMARYLQ